jgi:hypothetical protein
MTITLTREEAQQVLDALMHQMWSRRPLDATEVAMETLRARLAQPEPEPVAKMREMLEVQGRDGTWNYDPYFHGMYNGMEFMLALAEGRDPVFRKAPEKWLNAPPQREWQGLTGEELQEIYQGAGTVHFKFAMVEAKLKEKNA